ncbi:MAG TPA: helix-turn-helix domain-containing protein, partial [Micromonosporaceae bacterium]|nr:helix-turn-helix domain-containing protein [Micromonosporaceae bacterium]
MDFGIDPQRIPSVQDRHIGRVVSIVEAVTDAEAGLGISELARRVDLAKTTAARMLTDLVELGMLDRVHEVYLPGPRLLAMSHRVEPPGAAARRTLVAPHLARLRDETGLATAFSTLRYGRVRVESVCHVSASAEALAEVPRWPLAQHTGSGKVLLAFTPEAEALPVDHRDRVPYPDYVVT